MRLSAIILLGAALLACAKTPDMSGAAHGAHFRIVATAKGDLWRIDTDNGKVSFCNSPDEGKFGLICFGTTEGP